MTTTTTTATEVVVAAAAAAPKSTAMAPKKLLKKREPIRASFKIVSRTIFPSKEPAFKVQKTPIIPDREDLTPIQKFNTANKAQDEEIARSLPPITQRKVDKYGNPWYRAWSPLNKATGEGCCLLEDHMVVLVHHKARGEETEEMKPASEYMTFQQLKQHSLIKLKEVPLEAKFGADLMFVEDAQLRADSILKLEEGGGRIQKKGLFCAVWRRTHADMEGYDKFIADLSAFHTKRQWADW
jgi:hypothetical protein